MYFRQNKNSMWVCKSPTEEVAFSWVCAIKPISVGRSVSHLATCRVVYKISTCAVQAGVVQRIKVYTIVELLIVQVCSTLHTVGCIKSTTKYHPTWFIIAFERVIIILLHGKTRSPVSLLQQSDGLYPAIIYCCHWLDCSCTCVVWMPPTASIINTAYQRWCGTITLTNRGVPPSTV